MSWIRLSNFGLFVDRVKICSRSFCSVGSKVDLIRSIIHQTLKLTKMNLVYLRQVHLSRWSSSANWLQVVHRSFSFFSLSRAPFSRHLTHMLHCQAACWALTWFIDLIFYFMSCWSINAIKCEHNQPDDNQKTNGWIGFSTLIQAEVQSQVNDHFNRLFIKSFWPMTVHFWPK